jgi:hypothetical protein
MKIYQILDLKSLAALASRTVLLIESYGVLSWIIRRLPKLEHVAPPYLDPRLNRSWYRFQIWQLAWILTYTRRYSPRRYFWGHQGHFWGSVNVTPGVFPPYLSSGLEIQKSPQWPRKYGQGEHPWQFSRLYNVRCRPLGGWSKSVYKLISVLGKNKLSWLPKMWIQCLLPSICKIIQDSRGGCPW